VLGLHSRMGMVTLYTHLSPL